MAARRILMAVVGRAHGVRGLVRVQSYATDPAQLPAYGPLEDEQGRRFALRWRGEGVAELAAIIDGQPRPIADRSAAERLVNLRLYVGRDRLPPPDEEEFYLADLVGLRAVTPEGEELGTVAAVHDYGAGASLEIGRLLLPFTRTCVPQVDLDAGRLVAIPPAEVAAREAAA